ncbi:LysR family transcriptional regulator [Crossiella sp. SN42]|uniref:LysR family transcriptional regulator n=1 Tax=Crossiella sp. SN42 TaxID=2944808 RepID=UPI00207CBC84|nr:LysR family transcriptional regulator [Crossiella sp. SN42]MCO1574342.1 LysR family transcriptional regulator [Crossiella sp. SN42]
MEFRQLRSFVVLAEELHFGRAAARLGIAQPSLSQQLQQLETELATTLVHRTSRHVTLTEAGELLLRGAHRTLAEAERAVDAVHDLKAGRLGRLVIGSLGAGLNGPLPGVIRRLRQANDKVTVELRQFSDSASQERGLLDGTLDIAVLRQVAGDRAIVTRQLLTEPFLVYLPSDHRFAGRAELRLAELAEETFVSWPRHLGPSFHDLVTDACHQHGFTPAIEGLGDSLVAQLALVAAGVGVCVQALSNATLRREGTTVVPLRPSDITAQLHLAYRHWHHDTPVVDAFLACLPRFS